VVDAQADPDRRGGGAGEGRGPLEGAKDEKVYDAKGDTITDIDLIEDDRLWEKKSAENAGDVKDWVQRHVTEKLQAYLNARDRLPAYYKSAKIGFIFERILEEELWSAGLVAAFCYRRTATCRQPTAGSSPAAMRSTSAP
jgi:hypothetical protein